MMIFLGEEVNDLCMRMGVALSVWQGVETEHYHMFLTLLGIQDGNWPAPGSEYTELGVLMEPEVRHGAAEVYAGVQA